MNVGTHCEYVSKKREYQGSRFLPCRCIWYCLHPAAKFPDFSLFYTAMLLVGTFTTRYVSYLYP